MRERRVTTEVGASEGREEERRIEKGREEEEGQLASEGKGREWKSLLGPSQDLEKL